MGLSFQGLAKTRGVPFWQALATGNQLTAPEFSFYLARHVDEINPPETSPGGVMTLGGRNSSLFTGDVDFVNLVAIGGVQHYWSLSLSAVTVQGKPVTVTTGVNALSVIDTGTTLIGGPSRDVATIWAAIPGSVALSGSNAGFYAYRKLAYDILKLLSGN